MKADGKESGTSMSTADRNQADSVEADRKLDQLLEGLKPLGRLIVAFSGGVDSSVVVAAAARALGTENVVAVTALSETLPERELREATELARSLGVTHRIIETRELDEEQFQANAPDRCYHCKTELWKKIMEIARETGFKNLADGVNAGDTLDFRPGIRASDEAGVLHPLAKAGAGKAEVRAMARSLGLSNWDKPSQACLSSRFPYGDRITPEALQRVEAAEEFLHGVGLSGFRVRIHGEMARIEVSASDIDKVASAGLREKIVSAFKGMGYRYVALDLEGFRSGSLNEVLSDGSG